MSLLFMRSIFRHIPIPMYGKWWCRSSDFSSLKMWSLVTCASILWVYTRKVRILLP